MSWMDILKLKTNEGKRLVVVDVEEFKRLIRAALRPLVLEYYGGSKSYIVIKENWQGDEKLILNVSIRSKYTKTRHYWTIVMIENDEGDFEYLSTQGPHFVMGDNDVVESEGVLISKLMEAVNTQIYETMPKVLVPKKKEGEKTAEQYAKELEEANPGYEYVNGKFKKKPMVMRIEDYAREQGIL